jgi:ABC-type glycerol-3-phosphate transport system permease component
VIGEPRTGDARPRSKRVIVRPAESDFIVPRTGSSLGRKTVRILEHAILILAAVISIAPLYLLVITSLKTSSEFYSDFGSWLPPAHLTFSKYVGAWTDLGFDTMLKNSLILSVTASAITTMIAAMAGYALSRLTFRGRKLMLVGMIALLSIPPMAIIIPLFTLMSDWGLLNTYPSAIIAEVGIGTPFAVYLTYIFMREIPGELFEAAATDGASAVKQFLFIALPMAKPILATVALITAIFAWNDLLIPLVLWENQQLQVLMVGLANLAPGRIGNTDIPLVTAGVMISVVPIVILFVLAKRFFVRGLSEGIR